MPDHLPGMKENLKDCTDLKLNWVLIGTINSWHNVKIHFQIHQGLSAELFLDGSECSLFPAIDPNTGAIQTYPNGEPAILRFINFCYTEQTGEVLGTSQYMD